MFVLKHFMQNPQNLWLYGVAISASRTWFFLDVSRSLINILLKHLFTVYVFNWLLYYCMCGYVGCSYKWALFPNAHRGFLSLNQQALPTYELVVEFFKISHKMLNGKKMIVWNSCSVITQSSNWMPPRKSSYVCYFTKIDARWAHESMVKQVVMT